MLTLSAFPALDVSRFLRVETLFLLACMCGANGGERASLLVQHQQQLLLLLRLPLLPPRRRLLLLLLAAGNATASTLLLRLLFRCQLWLMDHVWFTVDVGAFDHNTSARPLFLQKSEGVSASACTRRQTYTGHEARLSRGFEVSEWCTLIS